MSVSTGCTEKCWTAVRCPIHDRTMSPRGRSTPMQDSDCCANADKAPVNPRHLWDEHDSTRWYTDPDGWSAHVARCTECRGAKP